jgi:hypothetical protein
LGNVDGGRRRQRDHLLGVRGLSSTAMAISGFAFLALALTLATSKTVRSERR